MNERGFTLAELLVFCAIIAIVMAGVFTLQQEGQLAYLWGATRVEVQQNARLALDMMMRELRSAVTVTACAATSLSFTAPDPNNPAVIIPITYSLSGTTLLWTVPGVASPNDQLIGGVQTLTITCFTSDGYTPTTVAASVRSVMISIQAQGGTGFASGGYQQVVVQDRVRLRNL